MRILSTVSMILFLILVNHLPVLAQNTGNITGVVLNASNKQPLQGVTVVIEETSLKGLSDSMGRYRITGIPAGSYTVSFSMVLRVPDW